MWLFSSNLLALLGLANNHRNRTCKSRRWNNVGTLVLPKVLGVRSTTKTATTLYIILQRLLRLLRGSLLHPFIKQIILALPISSLRKRFEVTFNASSDHDHALGLKLGLNIRDLIQQCSCALASYASSAIHHDRFILQFLLRFRGIQPFGKILRGTHLRIEELSPSLRWLEVPNSALVRVTNIYNDRVLLLHLLVIVGCFQMVTRVTVQGGSLDPVESVADELVHLAESEGTKAILVWDAIF
mmetsp:Transcript_19338/g.41961  ORF Transcript_19338/g.41961 Transcript_19338/m.41961 type:complete len:242 (-) Transcript_19338:513-1238(-)